METEENKNNQPPKRKWRKKRKNFLSNAKKYAKKGQMGRGTKMSEEFYQYFVGILDVIKEGIQDEEERSALVNNVLERTIGEELNIIGNQLGCRVIEILLPFASEGDLERFMEVINPELRRLCCDNFSSHVVEALLKVSTARAISESQETESEVPKKKVKLKQKPSKYSEGHVKNCHEFTLKISKYALNNLEEFVWDPYANHILRSCLRCLSGITALPGEKIPKNIFTESTEAKNIPPHETCMVYKNVPNEFKDLVKEFAERLLSWPQFKELPYQNITSALLQVLLYAIKNVDRQSTKVLLKKLLNESFVQDDIVGNSESKDDKKSDGLGDDDDDKMKVSDDQISKDASAGKPEDAGHNNLPPVFNCESSVRLLEACIFVAKKKIYTQIYAKCFINRLGKLATSASLNYTVQRLIDNCQIQEEFEPMFDELADKFDRILKIGNTGVLVALAKGCVRVNSRQTHFLRNLEQTLKCEDKEKQKYFPIACLKLQPLDKIEVEKLDQPYFIHVHGSVILQTILDFQRPTKAVSGLLELTADQLVTILTDAKGCHVADAFCKGRHVGAKSRDRLVAILKGRYQTLALSQYGSRAFEEIFHAASMDQKISIMQEMSDKRNLLNGTQHGKLIASKFDVDTFKQSRKRWEQVWKKRDNEKVETSS